MSPVGYLDVINHCDSVPYPGEEGYETIERSCYKFLAHDGHTSLGRVLPIVADQLVEFDEFVHVDRNNLTITLSSSLSSCELRTDAMATIVSKWRSKNTFQCLKGWRNELFTIYNPAGVVYLLIERASASLFGFTTYGVHIVGYNPATIGQEMKVWVATRSFDKPTYPGKYDNMVAGGIGYPHGVLDTVVKECHEEASLEEQFVIENLKPVGVVSFNYRSGSSIDHELRVFQPKMHYVYELRMNGVTPRIFDDEVHEFRLIPASQVKQELLSGYFSYSCALVQVYFFIKHGLITEEMEPNYHEILQRCQRRLEHPTM